MGPFTLNDVHKLKIIFVVFLNKVYISQNSSLAAVTLVEFFLSLSRLLLLFYREFAVLCEQ